MRETEAPLQLQVGAEWIAEIVGRIKNDDCAYFHGPGTDGAICRTSRLAAQQQGIAGFRYSPVDQSPIAVGNSGRYGRRYRCWSSHRREWGRKQN